MVQEEIKVIILYTHSESLMECTQKSAMQLLSLLQEHIRTKYHVEGEGILILVESVAISNLYL